MISSLRSIGYDILHHVKNSQEAITCINNKLIDLALIDIGLAKSQLDGISLAKEINTIAPNIKLIFTTSFSDQVTLQRSSEVIHQNFLIKPVGNEQLSVSIQKAFTTDKEVQVFSNTKSFQFPFSVVNEEVYIKSSHNKYYYKVNIRDIIYLQTTNKGVEFFTKNQSFFTYTSLSETLSKLNHPNIVQVHRQFAVNTLSIKAKSDSDILLINDKEIPIGRSFKTHALESLFTRI